MTSTRSRGAVAAVTAFFIWGLFPLFWRLLGDVPALQLLAHRAVWCAVAVWGLLLARGELAWVRQLTPRLLVLLSAGGVLISVNWGVYVWAVVTGHVIDTSLGYFITPLVSVLVAVWVLGERLLAVERLAVALAAAGVLYLAWQLRAPPWIALALATSFGTYGLVRKLAPFDSIRGLAIESGVMFPPAALYLLWCQHSGQGAFLHGHWREDLLLIAGGPITAVPLVLFAYAAQRVSMLALGIMQYVSPSVALLLGIWVFHEPFGGARQVAFGCIWAALLLFSVEALRRYRAFPAGTGVPTR
ncbi:MAG TPA: EamA family transporter RarD [Steroidobacteraceae bacterium]|nr:EamA family transporter RarD [Steroidobacteraceae bacterium]